MMRVILALALARDAAAQWGVSVKGPTIPAGCTRWNDVRNLPLARARSLADRAQQSSW